MQNNIMNIHHISSRLLICSLLTVCGLCATASQKVFAQFKRYSNEVQTNDNDKMNNPAVRAMMNVQDSSMVFPESVAIEDDASTWNWMDRAYIHADPNCVSDEQVPDVPDSIYIMRLKALPTIIDMPFNQPVRQCLDLYVHRRRSMVERMVGIGYNHFFPVFEDALQRYGLPSELKYLACIESGLRQNAYSRARAAGLWQFIPSTGILNGLEINSYIDERYDLYKSTDAACRFLLQLYNTFQDWPLAIAAYNCGPGNVNKAIARSGGRHTFWEIYNFLPAETRSYVPLFIAATYIMTYHCEHNLCAMVTEIPPQCDTIMLYDMVHFDQISNYLELPTEQLESLNPQYIFDIVPGSMEKPKSLTLPANKAYEFIEMQDSIFAWKADSLLPHNGDLKEVPVRGKRNTYVKNGGNTGAGKGGKGAAGTLSAGGTIYTVKSGDTLGAIARRCHTSVNAIKRLNGLKSDKLRIGQKLRVK